MHMLIDFIMFFVFVYHISFINQGWDFSTDRRISAFLVSFLLLLWLPQICNKIGGGGGGVDIVPLGMGQGLPALDNFSTTGFLFFLLDFNLIPD